MIQKKPIHAAPSQLQRLLLHLQNMITLYTTSQEKKLSWQTALVTSYQEKKTCQASYTKTYKTYALHLTKYT